ncbi:otoraplin-like isoform X1 [Alosa sapidissima]|uniref:otoraplin-like isoform X1 n=2 Tax=Alosa TaxID=34772 RepID=UPI001C0887B3|nr:otoraplin-like isoform X1 [Alosa sapidissima]
MMSWFSPSTVEFYRNWPSIAVANLKMSSFESAVLLLLSMGYLCQSSRTPLEKLADNKLCADMECSYAISLAMALEDYVAPDCRFINLKRGQMIYVYSKLLPAEGGGIFWSGSVYSERYVDQMGIIGFFPVNYVNETYTFQRDTVKLPTTDTEFICI